jgi:hypothetical protein
MVPEEENIHKCKADGSPSFHDVLAEIALADCFVNQREIKTALFKSVRDSVAQGSG